MLTNLLILSIPVSAAALLYARREYRKRGRLTALGLLLLCLMLLVPNLVLEYATRYELPSTALDYLGVVVGVAGLALCLIGIFNFDSLAKVLCLEPRSLTRSGFYRWSRNPQYLGWFPQRFPARFGVILPCQADRNTPIMKKCPLLTQPQN
jgi:protein-S-isoprenylcysteine O-methyltransferase Ste14